MLMEWPVSDNVWKDDLTDAREAFAQVARSIAGFEPVTIIANPQAAEEARKQCQSNSGYRVEVLSLAHDDCWVRDNGPTFLKDEKGALCAVNWHFNAWGGIYGHWELDNTIPERLCKLWNIPLRNADLVLEGGSIHTNGKGVILTTEECLLNKNRNPHLGRQQIEEKVLENLGAHKMIWLPFGLYGDETSGHVDNICCFIDESTALLAWTDEPASPNFERVRKAKTVLRENGISVEALPLPPNIEDSERVLAPSYINFVFVNGGIVMPAFGGGAERESEEAKHRLSLLFPSREIVSPDTSCIIKGGGNIHCITQQVPL